MVKKSKDKQVEVKKELFGTKGPATIRHILSGPEEMYQKGRAFAHTSLAPGGEIGSHFHHGESETYYIIKGTAQFNDNGTMFTLECGDTAHTASGQSHGIKNIGDDDLEFIALILND